MDVSSVASLGEFRVVLVGDSKVGKTVYWQSVAAKGTTTYTGRDVSICRVEMQTNHGSISFALWDTAAFMKWGRPREDALVGAHGVIIMFDLSV
jgi:GTPase SAR1 family protein